MISVCVAWRGVKTSGRQEPKGLTGRVGCSAEPSSAEERASGADKPWRWRGRGVI